MDQRELLQEALDLAEGNPEAKIHVCVAVDELCIDCAWNGQEITRVELVYCYFAASVEVYTDVEDVKEQLEEDRGEDVSYEEAYAQMEPAILMYTNA